MAERPGRITDVARPRRERMLVVAATLVFAAQMWAQILWTPAGEGMDVFGHLAYIEFVARERRGPRPDEPSVPRDIARFRDACLTNAYLCPGAYAEWRGASESTRAERRAALTAEPDAPYVEANYQAQHPVIYYWLMSWPYRAVRAWQLDSQITALSLLSVALAATAIPAVHLLFASLFPRSSAWPLVLVVAWFPNLMPFLGRITNDALAVPLAAWLVATMAGATRSRHPIRQAALLLGTGCWTKTYFLTMVPVFLCWSVLWNPQTADDHGGARRRRLAPFVSGLALLLTLLVPLFVLNLQHTGHLLPLLEAQRTIHDSLGSKVLALFALDPYWFLAGLARNAFWSGYWSFVSPHLLYYVPLATPLVLALVSRPRLRDVAARLRQAWLHVALLGAFLAGLWWHAALFALDAQRRGLTVHSGNEGYYALVLLPSALLLSVWPWWTGLTPRAWARLLRAMAVLAVAWNIAARIAMAAFWGGAVPLGGRERLLDPGSLARAIVDPSTWTSWLSLPGVTAGAPWLPLTLLVVAFVLTSRILTDAALASEGTASPAR